MWKYKYFSAISTIQRFYKENLPETVDEEAKEVVCFAVCFQ